MQVETMQKQDVPVQIFKKSKIRDRKAPSITNGVVKKILKDFTRPTSIITDDGRQVWSGSWMHTSEFARIVFKRDIFASCNCILVPNIVRDTVESLFTGTTINGYCHLYSLYYMEHAKFRGLELRRQNYLSFFIAGIVVASKLYEEHFVGNPHYSHLMHLVMADPVFDHLKTWDDGTKKSFYSQSLNTAEKILLAHVDYMVYIPLDRFYEYLLSKKL